MRPLNSVIKHVTHDYRGHLLWDVTSLLLMQINTFIAGTNRHNVKTEQSSGNTGRNTEDTRGTNTAKVIRLTTERGENTQAQYTGGQSGQVKLIRTISREGKQDKTGSNTA